MGGFYVLADFDLGTFDYLVRHPRRLFETERGSSDFDFPERRWIPAFAGMSKLSVVRNRCVFSRGNHIDA
jgi:hypothetical protein